MPNVSRPDLLPFALPKRIGLPYHGPIVGNKMTLPNAAQMTYPQPNDGSTILVEAPGAAAPVLSAEDTAALTARGQQWLTYAYLSGKDHDIGGQSLGANRWLYCDGNRTWLMRWERNYVTEAPATSTFDIYVEALFGYFGQTEYTTINRKIYSYSTQSDTLSIPGSEYPHYWLLAPGIAQPMVYYSKTGAKILVNLIDTYTQSSALTYFYRSFDGPVIRGGSYTFVELWETFTITISGQGSTDPASAGTGITASSAVVFSDGKWGCVTFTETGELPPDLTGPHYEACYDEDCNCSGTYNDSTAYSYSYSGTYFYVMDENGTVDPVTYELISTIDWTVESSWSYYKTPLGGCDLDSINQVEVSVTATDFSISLGATPLLTYPTYTQTVTTTYNSLSDPTVERTTADFWWIGPTPLIGQYGGLYTKSDEGHIYGYLKTVSDTSEDLMVVHLGAGAIKSDGSTARSYTYDIKNADWYSAAAPASIAFA